MKKSQRPILIVIGNNKNGGIAKHAAMLANGFSDMGREATIVITKDKTNNSFFDLKERAHIINIGDPAENINAFKTIRKKMLLQIKILKMMSELIPKDAKCKKQIHYSVSKIRQTLSLKQALMNYDNPIIIALGLDYAVDVFYATRGKKCNLIYGTRTYAEGEVGNHDRDIILGILNKFSCVVSQTSYTADYFRDMGVQQIEVIGNPLELELDPYVGERNKSIVNFCRISKEKRLDLLICAFSEFCREYSEYHIDIYGNIVTQTEEEHKSELLNVIDELGLNGRVMIHAARKNIHEIVKDAAMFISTSEFEGLSNSMIEAMALGLPCICTDCDGGGAREQIENEVNGLLIPKNSEKALVEAMKRFAQDTEFAKKCGENAITIREKLEIHSIVSQWQYVIDKYCN